MRNQKDNPERMKQFQEDILKRICQNCHAGLFMSHPKDETLWKCGICGNTVEAPKGGIKEYLMIDMPSSNQD